MWPANRSDYSLEVVSNRASRLLYKGEVSNYDWRSKAASQIKSPTDVWVIPGFAQVKFNRYFVNNCQCAFGYVEHFAEISVRNDWGQDLVTSYGATYGFEALILQTNGAAVPGSQYFYSTNVSSPMTIAPGLEKVVDLNIGAADVSGAVLVLVWHAIDGNVGSDRWVAWQLP